MKVDRVTMERLLRSGMRKVKKLDFAKVIRRSPALRRLTLGPLADIADDINVLFALVRDFATGHYRDIPYRSIAAAVVGLLYVLNPFDLIPDFVPGVGFIDDTAVVALVIQMIRKDLDEYRTWTQRLVRKLRHLSAAI